MTQLQSEFSSSNRASPIRRTDYINQRVAELLPALRRDVDHAWNEFIEITRNYYFSISFRRLLIQWPTSWASALAEEATQETLIRIYKNITKFDPDHAAGAKFTTWSGRILANTTSNVADKERRKYSQYSINDKEGHEWSDSNPTIEEDIAKKEQLNILAEALEQLSLEEFELLQMKYMDKLSSKQIAEKVGKKQNTIDQQYRRLLKRLKHKI